MILVTGGSASGKSAFAEKLAVEHADGKKLYIATMKPGDRECRERIQKHRRRRAAENFVTVECYGLTLADLCRADGAETYEEATALFECMSNYVSNCMFGEENGLEASEAGDKAWEEHLADCIVSELKGLDGRLGTFIIVSNEVFSDGKIYDSMTTAYLRVLGNCNQRLAAAASQVYEVVCGIPLLRKG